MGWWIIDPDTGQPPVNSTGPKDSFIESELDEFDQTISVLGDPPCDYATDAVDRIQNAYAHIENLTSEQLQALFRAERLHGTVESERPLDHDEIHEIVEPMWEEIDEAYREILDRPANAAERRWIGEYMIEHLHRRI